MDQPQEKKSPIDPTEMAQHSKTLEQALLAVANMNDRAGKPNDQPLASIINEKPTQLPSTPRVSESKSIPSSPRLPPPLESNITVPSTLPKDTIDGLLQYFSLMIQYMDFIIRAQDALFLATIRNHNQMIIQENIFGSAFERYKNVVNRVPRSVLQNYCENLKLNGRIDLTYHDMQHIYSEFGIDDTVANNPPYHGAVGLDNDAAMKLYLYLLPLRTSESKLIFDAEVRYQTYDSVPPGFHDAFLANEVRMLTKEERRNSQLNVAPDDIKPNLVMAWLMNEPWALFIRFHNTYTFKTETGDEIVLDPAEFVMNQLRKAGQKDEVMNILKSAFPQFCQLFTNTFVKHNPFGFSMNAELIVRDMTKRFIDTVNSLISTSPPDLKEPRFHGPVLSALKRMIVDAGLLSAGVVSMEIQPDAQEEGVEYLANEQGGGLLKLKISPANSRDTQSLAMAINRQLAAFGRASLNQKQEAVADFSKDLHIFNEESESRESKLDALQKEVAELKAANSILSSKIKGSASIANAFVVKPEPMQTVVAKENAGAKGSSISSLPAPPQRPPSAEWIIEILLQFASLVSGHTGRRESSLSVRGRQIKRMLQSSGEYPIDMETDDKEEEPHEEKSSDVMPVLSLSEEQKAKSPVIKKPKPTVEQPTLVLSTHTFPYQYHKFLDDPTVAAVETKWQWIKTLPNFKGFSLLDIIASPTVRVEFAALCGAEISDAALTQPSHYPNGRTSARTTTKVSNFETIFAHQLLRNGMGTKLCNEKSTDMYFVDFSQYKDPWVRKYPDKHFKYFY